MRVTSCGPFKKKVVFLSPFLYDMKAIKTTRCRARIQAPVRGLRLTARSPTWASSPESRLICEGCTDIVFFFVFSCIEKRLPARQWPKKRDLVVSHEFQTRFRALVFLSPGLLVLAGSKCGIKDRWTLDFELLKNKLTRFFFSIYDVQLDATNRKPQISTLQKNQECGRFRIKGSHRSETNLLSNLFHDFKKSNIGKKWASGRLRTNDSCIGVCNWPTYFDQRCPVKRRHEGISMR